MALLKSPRSRVALFALLTLSATTNAFGQSAKQKRSFSRERSQPAPPTAQFPSVPQKVHTNAAIKRQAPLQPPVAPARIAPPVVPTRVVPPRIAPPVTQKPAVAPVLAYTPPQAPPPAQYQWTGPPRVHPKAGASSPAPWQSSSMPSYRAAPGYTAAYSGGYLPPQQSPSGVPSFQILPPVLPYRDGQPVDPMYRKESSGNTGLIVGGTLTFLASYGAAVGYGANQDWKNGLRWNTLPVAGPFFAIGKRDFGCKINTPSLDVANQCMDDAMSEVEAVAILAVDGLIQTIGATLLIAGVLDRDTLLVRNDVASLSVRRAGKDGYSLNLRQRF